MISSLSSTTMIETNQGRPMKNNQKLHQKNPRSVARVPLEQTLTSHFSARTHLEKPRNGMKINLSGESTSLSGLTKVVRKKTKSQESTEDSTSSGVTEPIPK